MNITNQEKSECRKAFEVYRDERNARLESEGHKPGSKWHVTNAHHPTWEASRAAMVIELPPSLADDMTLIEAIQLTGAKVK